MRPSHTIYNILTVLLCLSLIVQSIAAIPPQELCTEHCQQYAFLSLACLISFCIGTVLCTLIHKFYIQPSVPTHLSKTMNLEEEMLQVLQQWQTNGYIQKEKREQNLSKMTEQETTKEKNTTNNSLNLSLCILMVTPSSFATTKEKELPIFKKTIPCNQITYENIFVPVAYYWMSKYKEQKKVEQKILSLKSQRLLN